MPGRVLLATLVASTVLIAAWPHAAAAAEACQETTVTAPAAADAWLDQNSPFGNKGSDSLLTVRSGAPEKNARTLVRFTLPASVPPGCVLEVAKLRLFAPSGSPESPLEAVRLAFGWSESLVSWSDQPATAGPPAVTWAGEGFVQWTVTDQVEAMLGGANHGFLIRDAAESSETGEDQAFHSREKGDAESPPQLVIRFAAPKSGDPPGPPEQPVPAAVQCGQELTRSVRLTNDLSECPGDGLVIGEERIIVDLGGHTIDGVGLGTGVRNDGYDTVTIRNGTIKEFDYGIQLLPETDLNVVERLSLRLNQLGGIELADAGAAQAGNEVRGNSVEQNGDGIALLKGTTATLVTGNTMTLNGGPGLLVSQSEGNRLEDNRVGGGGDLGVGFEHASGNVLRGNSISANSDGGIELTAGSDGNRIEGNTVRDSGDTGILVSESDRNELIGNSSHFMSDSGITLNSANDGVVRGNDVSFNSGGIQMDGSSRNLLEANDASETTGIGIELGGGSLENRLVRNVAGANGAQGIYVSDDGTDGTGNLLERNEVSGNSSDGIATGKGGHTLSFNAAHDNRGWGINAAPGTIDGRGNVALGNREPQQCIGIVCNADGAPPETSIGSRPPDPSGSRAASFTFTGSDNRTAPAALRFECRLDGAAFTACSSPRSYAALGDGSHTFEVRAIDAAGNVDGSPSGYSWVIDTVAPDTTIGDAPADPSNSPGATFEFGAGEPAAFQCQLDSGAWAPCSSPQTYGDLADGEHSFRVRATDQAGNSEAAPAVYAWRVDTTPPETTIDGGPAGHSKVAAPVFEFSASEAAGFECKLDAREWVACTSPYQLPALADGEHSFHVQATDEAENRETSPAVHAWTVDTAAPRTSIDAGPPDPSNRAVATFEFRADEAVTFECRLDAAAFSLCSSPQAYADLGDGAHTFQVRAIDQAGNVDASPASHSWVVDTVAPDTSIGDRPSDPTESRSASFSFAGSDDRSAPSGLRFECRLDGAPFAPCTAPHAYTQLAEGSHDFEVRAIDQAGNVDPSAAGHRWTIEAPAPEPAPDTTAPQTTLGDRPADPTNSRSAAFTFGGSDDRTAAGSLRFQCRLDNSSVGFSDCSSPRSYTGLADGSHRFDVRAVDLAGNVDPSPATYTWTVDTVPPQTTIASAPPALTSNTSTTFVFSSNSAGSTFECSLDGAPFGSCASPRTYTGLQSSSHQFRVRAIDPAGNVDATPATHSWTVDATPPQTTIDSGPPATTSSTAASFTFSSGESGSSFQCRLDNESFAGCTSPRQYAGLPPGPHTFHVRSIDGLGNVDQTPATHTWTIDTTPTGCRPVTVTAAAAADSWVLQSSSTSNYGRDSVLKVDSKNGANARALVRFALPAIPSGCQVTSARLRLYASSYKTGRVLQALRAAATWTETGLTWANQPATTGAAATVASGSGYREWTVTAQVQAMYTDGNHGFLIRDSAENGGGIEQGFHAREKGRDNQPALVIGFGS